MSNWVSAFPFLEGVPKWICILYLHGFVFFFLLTPFYLFFSAVERKWAADVQARVGPSLVGGSGLLQPIADQIKLFSKRQQNYAFSLISIVIAALLFFQIGTVPLTTKLTLINSDAAPFAFLWFSLLLNFVLWFTGVKKRAINEEVAANRWIIQTLAGILPASVATVAALIGLSSFGWNKVLMSQGFYPWQWAAVRSPFHFLEFCIFILSAALATSSGPFSNSFKIFRSLEASFFLPFVRFMTLANFMLVGAALFLGGPTLPAFLKEVITVQEYPFIVVFLEWSIHAIKAWILLSVLLLLERVLPHLSSRQASRFGFNFLLPFSIIFLIAAIIWRFYG